MLQPPHATPSRRPSTAKKIKKDDDIIISDDDDSNKTPVHHHHDVALPWHDKLDELLPLPILHAKKKALYMKKKFGMIGFLVFLFLKMLCSLVMLNFYMASKISVMHLEDSLPLLRVHRYDRDRTNATNNIANRDIIRRSSGSMQIITSNHSTIQQKTRNDTISAPKSGMIVPNLAGTLLGKERLWNILITRNVTQVDAEYWKSIPTWDQILQNIHHSKDGDEGASPTIYGLDTCEAFQKATADAPSQRRIAPAGLFNTGTNYLSVLLEYNCQNPYRVEKFHGNAKRGHGNEWETPWGKHTPASYRGKYNKNKNLKYTVDEVLPIVLIRNPYGWMKSMCRNPYTAKWTGMHHQKTCPELKTNDGTYNPVDVKFGPGSTHHESLGHLWNDWYGEYFYSSSNSTDSQNKKTTDAPFPRLMIRFEDIIFFPYEVTKRVCECAGGVLGHRQDDKDVANNTFHYVVRSAKAGFGHGPAEHRNGLIDSWARYGSRDPKDEYADEEIQIAKDILDPLFMETFGYR